MAARRRAVPTRERLAALVRRFQGRRVLVVADLVADEFLYGRIDRVSREDIRRVATEYFTESNRSIAYLEPEGEGQ